VKASVLSKLLPQIKSNNAQKEYYLTDLISLAVDAKIPVEGLKSNPRVALGVNNQKELSRATRLAFKRKAEQLMESGVMMIQPATCFIEDTVKVAPAAMIYPNVFLRGQTEVGALSVIESGCMLTDAKIGDNVHVKAGCYVQSSSVGDGTELGPYAHLRPGSEVAEECKIGNFVELKKVKFGKGAKASHLTYLGDAEVGENTNIGCGVITCNYAVDKKKYVTKIGKDVFVGSDSQFIAPITIGDGSFIGSGSTITKDVPPGSLAVTRAKQTIIENYVPRSKADPKKEK
jgi:bifunctional UDP-N-acetylglucosamine pyrophosphorylase/glucosamine-1-phosphate N-acetyltransferase